jgi:hypothetical protein
MRYLLMLMFLLVLASCEKNYITGPAIHKPPCPADTVETEEDDDD